MFRWKWYQCSACGENWYRRVFAPGIVSTSGARFHRVHKPDVRGVWDYGKDTLCGPIILEATKV